MVVFLVLNPLHQMPTDMNVAASQTAAGSLIAVFGVVPVIQYHQLL
jgi:hypothetical protein